MDYMGYTALVFIYLIIGYGINQVMEEADILESPGQKVFFVSTWRHSGCL